MLGSLADFIVGIVFAAAVAYAASEVLGRKNSYSAEPQDDADFVS